MTKVHANRCCLAPSFESVEPRLLLSDVQVGTVAMPFNGFLSAGIYDSGGKLVRTLIEHQSEPVGNVTLTWDGLDDIGKAMGQSSAFTWKAIISQVHTVDEGGVGDSAIELTNPSADMGYCVQSLAVSNVGGITGEVGGTFTQSAVEGYYGDTSLNQSFNLNTPISASGDFYVSDFATMGDNTGGCEFYIGHFSSSTAATSAQFMGVEFMHGDAFDRVGVRARIGFANASAVLGAYSAYVNLMTNSGQYHFTYNYDPNYEADASHPGPEGRLTVHIFNDGSYDQTLYAVLAGAHRDWGSTFDSFGVGVESMVGFGGSNPARFGKLALDNVTYSGHSGVVDFQSDPHWVGANNNSAGNSYGWIQRNNLDDSLYWTAYAEEALETHGLNADGSTRWADGSMNNFGVAADEKYTFITRREDNQDRLYRYFSRDGALAPFAGPSAYVVINSSSPETKPSDQGYLTYTADEWRNLACWGEAADGFRVFVSNYRNDRLDIFDRNTGAKLGQLAVDNPLGIAFESASATSGVIWVANGGNRVSRYTFTIDGQGNYKFKEDISRRVSGLSDPTGVAVGGPNGHLFVAETGSTDIREFDIASTPALAGLGVFGSKDLGGALGDSEFYFNDTLGATASLAIDSRGILSVLDDHRIQRFYTVADAGAGKVAGDLYQSIFGEPGSSPLQTGNYGPNGLHTMTSGAFTFEVDPEYAGGPREGWLGDGSWRLVGRYYFNDVSGQQGGSTLRCTISDGVNQHDILYLLTNAGVAAYTMSPTGQQHLSAMVGFTWTGADQIKNGQGGQYVWTDADSDGAIDWNGVGSGVDGEVKWSLPLGTPTTLAFANAPYVDEKGNVWYTDTQGNLNELPLDGFDSRGNPLYDWTHNKVVVPYDSAGMGFAPLTVRIAGNGDIYALGRTKVVVGTGVLNRCGDWIAHYNSAGALLSMTRTFGDMYAAIAIDNVDATPDYYFAGDEQWAYMYTNDGLMVDAFTAGPASGGPSGWIDHPYALGAFTHPLTGEMYVYGEEVYYSKSIRWHVEGLDTLQRQQGTFTYTVPAGPTAQWNFDSSLSDAIGSNTATFTGGSPNYLAGKHGSAISLDGVDDIVKLPYARDFNAYTVSLWVKPSNINSVCVFSRTTSDGFSGIAEISITADGKFQHTEWEGGTFKTVTGTTTIQPDTWYHVAVTTQSNGMTRLYVNGVEEGTAQSVGMLLMWNGDQFNIGSGWGGPGMNPLRGQVDDVQVYERALSTAEIDAIVGPTVFLDTNDATASEAGTNGGMFTIRRIASAGTLTVNYTVGGTAINGADYSTLSGSVVFAPGQTSAVINVTPIDDTSPEVSESVIVTLNASASYNIGYPYTGTVTIADNDSSAITIPNGDFSNGLVGWASDGNRAVEYVYTPTAYDASTIAAHGTVADMEWGQSYDSPYVKTTLSTTYVLGNTYTFSMEIGFGNGYNVLYGDDPVLGGVGGGLALLDTSGNVLASAKFINHTMDTFQRFSVSYTATGADAGKQIVVGFAKTIPPVGHLHIDYDNAQLEVAAARASDTFESGNAGGGAGWGGSWSLTGNASVVSTSAPKNGNYHLQLTDSGAIAARAVNALGMTNPHLVFDWKANSFEAGDSVAVEIYNGSSWVTALTISDGQDDNAYHHSDLNLSSYALTSSFQVRFRSLMNAADDYFYVDNLYISQ